MNVPECRRHGPMAVLEEGILNGVLVRYYGCTACDRVVRSEATEHVELDLFGDVR